MGATFMSEENPPRSSALAEEMRWGVGFWVGALSLCTCLAPGLGARWKAAFPEELAHEPRDLTTHCFSRSLGNARLQRIGRFMLHLELAKRGSLLANLRK